MASVLANRPSPPPTCGGSRPAKPGGALYTCTFTDDFTNSALDSSKWTVATTAVNGFTTGTGDCYVNSPKNVSVSGGYLHLTSRVEATPFVCHSPSGDFTTSQSAGSVVSWGKFAQTYGRFEFRAKFPPAATAYTDSALWLYPQTSIYGAWPSSGEIDVAEWFGTAYSNHVFPSLHYTGETSASTGYNCVVPTAGTAFHTYAVSWTTTTMYFYYDNTLCFQHVWTPSAPLVAPKPFDQAFDLVMTQTGGTNDPVGTSATMDVDWVRAWK
jgi:beta-glucanase (GH16 family)